METTVIQQCIYLDLPKGLKSKHVLECGYPVAKLHHEVST